MQSLLGLPQVKIHLHCQPNPRTITNNSTDAQYRFQADGTSAGQNGMDRLAAHAGAFGKTGNSFSIGNDILFIKQSILSRDGCHDR